MAISSTTSTARPSASTRSTFDPLTGGLSSRRPFVEIPVAEGLPDGLVVDAEGCVWVALFGAGRVRRYTPGGRVAAELTLPVTLVTSMAFGGPGLDVMYLTTARHRLTAEEQADQITRGEHLRVTRRRRRPAGSAIRMGMTGGSRAAIEPATTSEQPAIAGLTRS